MKQNETKNSLFDIAAYECVEFSLCNCEDLEKFQLSRRY